MKVKCVSNLPADAPDPNNVAPLPLKIGEEYCVLGFGVVDSGLRYFLQGGLPYPLWYDVRLFERPTGTLNFPLLYKGDEWVPGAMLFVHEAFDDVEFFVGLVERDPAAQQKWLLIRSRIDSGMSGDAKNQDDGWPG